jgi:hypothetical protein
MNGTLRAVVLFAAITLAGCGGSAVSESPTTPTRTDAPSGAATSDAPSAITITRTGGIAGVRDVVQLAADGSVSVTQKGGASGSCTPAAEAVDRLRAIDLSALGSAPPKTPIADGFGYEIVAATGTASVGDGDTGAHGELLAAASAVVSSCLANVSGPSA